MVDRIQSLKEEIVRLALDEGETGIWEPLWELRSTAGAGASSDAGELVEAALRELYAEGRIVFFRRPWRDGESGDRAGMDETEIEHELSSTWWRELPLKRGDVWFAVKSTHDSPR
jgi:hypothetical protein